MKKGLVFGPAGIPLSTELRSTEAGVLRVHELGLGCPIVGDSLYGCGRQGDPMLLHAAELAFVHPATGNWTTLSSPVPF